MNRPTFTRLSDGTYPTGYYRLETVDRAGVDPAARRRIERIPAQWAAVTGKRTLAVAGQTGHPPFGLPTRHYHDPAKPRTLEQVAGELGKLISRCDDKRAHAEIGRRAILPGYVVAGTDGHVLVARPGTPHGVHADKPALFTSIIWAGTMPAEAWRDYSPVRHTVNERSRAIRWMLGPRAIGWYSRQPDLGESRSWSPWAAGPSVEPRTVTVPDYHLWPCRGVSWRVGTFALEHGPAAGLEGLVLAADGLAVLVAGMRL